MTIIILTLFGVFIGAAVAEGEGLILGFFIGLAFGLISNMKNRIVELEHDLAEIINMPERSSHRDDESNFEQTHEKAETADKHITVSKQIPVVATQVVEQPKSENVFSRITKFDDKSDWTDVNQTDAASTYVDNELIN